MPDEPLDPIIRKRLILADLGIDNSTLRAWMQRGDFPLPLVLNPGQKREIIGWPTSVYRQWKAARPQRLATPITDNAYSETARSKRRRTVLAKRGGSERLAENQGAPPREREQTEPPRLRVARPGS